MDQIHQRSLLLLFHPAQLDRQDRPDQLGRPALRDHRVLQDRQVQQEVRQVSEHLRLLGALWRYLVAALILLKYLHSRFHPEILGQQAQQGLQVRQVQPEQMGVKVRQDFKVRQVKQGPQAPMEQQDLLVLLEQRVMMDPQDPLGQQVRQEQQDLPVLRAAQDLLVPPELMDKMDLMVPMA